MGVRVNGCFPPVFAGQNRKNYFGNHSVKIKRSIHMNKLKLCIGIALLGAVFVSCGTSDKKCTDNSETETAIASAKVEHVELNIKTVFTASLEGQTVIVKEAINNGFDTNTIDKDGRTALMLAAYNGQTEIVKLLLSHNANANHTDVLKRTALMYASSGPFTETVLALLQAGAKPNLVEKEENWTAAMMAASEGQLEVLKTLVAHGADLTMVDVDGESSLDFASSKGHSAVADYIKTQLKQ